MTPDFVFNGHCIDLRARRQRTLKHRHLMEPVLMLTSQALMWQAQERILPHQSKFCCC
jgi:hypothetical protein